MSYKSTCQYMPSHMIFISIHSTTLDILMIACIIKICYKILLSWTNKLTIRIKQEWLNKWVATQYILSLWGVGPFPF